ncbi:MAG TPA: rRNA maturation RNase YbeY [Candidatus Hydrogenedentes bacterium]|nr:rRNA maturation RNase YbeY [Candidatus Hydrogenedentota bacterium]
MIPEVILEIRQASRHPRLYRRSDLESVARAALAECRYQGGPALISLLCCDNEEMTRLNTAWRGGNGPTDVLAFPAEPVPGPGPRVLGDIVISFELVLDRHGGDRSAARREIRLLFCHGLLHLLGMDHETARNRALMQAAQARVLGIPEEDAWIADDAH